jgi:hypothetical protein
MLSSVKVNNTLNQPTKGDATMNMKVNILKEFFASLKGNQFVSVVTDTEAELKKNGIDGSKNPYEEVRKISHTLCQAGFHYANSIRNQHEREGTSPAKEVQPRRWGRRLLEGEEFNGQVMEHDTPLVEHKGKLYVELKVERVIETARYYTVIDGRQVFLSNDWVAKFLPPVSHSSVQDNIQKKVILRDYALDSIVTLNGVAIEDLAPAGV